MFARKARRAWGSLSAPTSVPRSDALTRVAQWHEPRSGPTCDHGRAEPGPGRERASRICRDGESLPRKARRQRLLVHIRQRLLAESMFPRDPMGGRSDERRRAGACRCARGFERLLSRARKRGNGSTVVGELALRRDSHPKPECHRRRVRATRREAWVTGFDCGAGALLKGATPPAGGVVPRSVGRVTRCMGE